MLTFSLLTNQLVKYNSHNRYFRSSNFTTMAEIIFVTASKTPVVALTADEMREVDRIAVEEVGLKVLQMMENAGRILASYIYERVDGRVIIFAGNGGNGGGGLVCGRHLFNRDIDVTVVLDRAPSDLTGVAAHQCQILESMNIPIIRKPDSVRNQAASVIVDALIGYGLHGNVTGQARELITWINKVNVNTISLDVPSGLDATTGQAYGEAVTLSKIITLALPKTGLRNADVPLFLADISIPRVVYEQLGITYVNPFKQGDLTEIVGYEW